MTTPSPGWYADQANPRLLRWWDGQVWTQHTQPNGQQPPPVQQQDYQQPQQAYQPRQPQQGGQVGSGPLYTAESVLLAQKVKVLGMSKNAGAFELFDPDGTVIGKFREADDGGMAGAALRALNPLKDFATKRYELLDTNEQPLLKIAQGQSIKATLKPKFEVTTAAGTPIGTIEQPKVFSGRNFVFTVNGAVVGGFKTEGGWSRKFIVTAAGAQIAEIVKRSLGQTTAKQAFTHHDSYVLERPRPIPEPLGSLVLISACALDAVFFERK